MCGRRPKKIEVRKIEEELTTHYEHKKYCRVRIGDILGKRYHILGKLGYGQVSTVWFARNVEYVIHLAAPVPFFDHLQDSAMGIGQGVHANNDEGPNA